MSKRAWIRAAHLDHNMGIVRERCPNASVLAYVKADAYGHSIQNVVPHLSADMFAVTDIKEGLAVRQTGFSGPVLIGSDFYGDTDLKTAAENHLTPLLYSYELFERWLKYRPPEQVVWLKYDTGMSRLGMYQQEIEKCLGHHIKTVVMTHMAFAGANEYNLQAIDKITYLKEKYGVPICYAATKLLQSQVDLTNSDWVSPGLQLYGLGGSDLKMVMHLEAQVIAVKYIKKGDRVGYDGLFVADRPMKIAVVSIGYADGVPHGLTHFSFRTKDDQECKILGQVSMDLSVVRCPDNINEGDWLTVWSSTEHVESLCQDVNSNPYVLVTQLGHRITRQSC